MTTTKTGGVAVLVLLGFLLAAFVGVAITGWGLMLVLGIAHSYARSVPAIPYWPSVGIMAALNLVLGAFKKGVQK